MISTIAEKHLYGEAYFQEREAGAALRRIAYYQEYQRIIKRVSSGSLLDVGCGTGEFTALFPPDDWGRYGIDTDGYAQEMAERNGVKITDYGNLAFLSMDLVIFRGTLQHIYEPFYSLNHAYRVLKTGGLLAILAQPDADSLVYKLWHSLPALDPPRNWWVPGRYELSNILINLGFVDIEFSWPYLNGPYARPVYDFACFILRFFGVRKPFAFPGNMMEVYARKP